MLSVHVYLQNNILVSFKYQTDHMQMEGWEEIHPSGALGLTGVTYSRHDTKEVLGLKTGIRRLKAFAKRLKV